MAKKEKGEFTEVRIDKWLWAVRLFKTRTIASDACKKNRISIGTQALKPSRTVKVGDVIDVRRPPITYSFEVLALTDRRMGAKLVSGFVKDVTDTAQLEILEMSRAGGFIDRARGAGRPTKKERRDMEDFVDDVSYFEDWDLEDEE